MRVYRGFDAYPARPAPAAAAIGNFDGLHPGHVKILERLKSTAVENGWKSLVLTFDPHPARIFGHRKNFRLIQTVAQRVESFKSLGLDAVLIVPFENVLSDLAPDDFVDNILIRRLRAGAIIVGGGFRFGRGRTGDASVLRRRARRHRTAVIVVSPVRRKRRIVSSTLIRKTLGRGDVETAAAFLGRPYVIAGRVVRGRGRGSGLGFPTANIITENEILPEGVFITEVVFGRHVFPSLTSIGTCPTFKESSLSVETHLLDYAENLYGKTLCIRFLKKIRSQRVFPSPEALRKRIFRDRDAALRYFGRLDISPA